MKVRSEEEARAVPHWGDSSASLSPCSFLSCPSQDHLEIEDIETTPQAKVYSQKREGTPIKGGRRWKVQLDQGEETSLELRFKLVFSAKEEIVGGNRRE